MNEPVRSTGGCERLGSGMRVSGIRGLSFAAWARGLAFIVLFGMLGSAGAQAAFRNLLDEFYDALHDLDVKKVEMLLEEGLHPDTIAYSAIKNRGETISMGLITGDPGSQKAEKAFIEILKSIHDAGVDFSKIFKDSDTMSSFVALTFSLPIVEALFEMGAEADADIINKKVLTHNAIHTHEKDPNYISRVQFFLKKSGVKAEPSVITFVLSDCLSGLKFKKSVEDENKAVKDAIELIGILRDSGTKPEREKIENTLKYYREDYKNIPELLKYFDELEKACATSWLDFFRFW